MDILCTRPLRTSCGIALLVLACTGAALAVDAQSVPGLEVQVDNDGLNLWLPKLERTDGEYTNGVRVSFSRYSAPLWGRLFHSSRPCKANESATRRCLTTGFAIAQQIYTPLNAENEPRQFDRPFVGWLHIDGSANVTSTSRLRTVQLTAGFTGPPTLARSVQQGFHNVVGVTNGDGWKYQLGFSLAGSLTYTERLRSVLLSFGHRAIVDLLSSWSAQAGNSRTDAYAEVIARAGLHMPHPWNPASRNREGRTAFGVWLYGGFRETGVAYDQTLDRSWSRDGASYSVVRIPWVRRCVFGVGARHHSLMVTFGGTHDSQEYHTELAPHSYGSFTLTVDHGVTH